MTAHQNYHRLEQVVEQIDHMSKEQERVSVSDVLRVVGRRSFGPLLVFIGLLLAIPGVGDIPGVPVLFGLLILLTVGQQIIGRSHIWLPGWLLRRSAKTEYVQKTLSYARRPAHVIDAWTTERFDTLVTNRVSVYLSSLACISIALLTPAMEIVLLSANVAGVSLFLFGLAYVAHDGLVMLLSFLVYASLLALLVIGFT